MHSTRHTLRPSAGRKAIEAKLIDNLSFGTPQLAELPTFVDADIPPWHTKASWLAEQTAKALETPEMRRQKQEARNQRREAAEKEEIEQRRAQKLDRAEELRQNPTAEESALMIALDRSGIEYEHRPILCGYIPAFVFPKERKIVDFARKKKKEARTRDRQRDANLRHKGYTVLRLPPDLVFKEAPRGRLPKALIAFLEGRAAGNALKRKERERH